MPAGTGPPPSHAGLLRCHRPRLLQRLPRAKGEAKRCAGPPAPLARHPVPAAPSLHAMPRPTATHTTKPDAGMGRPAVEKPTADWKFSRMVVTLQAGAWPRRGGGATTQHAARAKAASHAVPLVGGIWQGPGCWGWRAEHGRGGWCQPANLDGMPCPRVPHGLPANSAVLAVQPARRVAPPLTWTRSLACSHARRWSEPGPADATATHPHL